MWRNIASNAVTLLIVALIVGAGLLGWAQRQFSGPGPLTQAICLKVERGGSQGAVSRTLEQRGAVSSAVIFRLGARYSNRDGLLKYGSFLITPESSMVGILDQITAGGSSTCGAEMNYRIGVLAREIVLREVEPVSGLYVELARFSPESVPETARVMLEDPDLRLQVTVAEGATTWQVVEALQAADFLSGEIGQVPSEGTLAPVGYEVVRGADRTRLLAEMAARQTRTLEDLWADRAEGLPISTPQEALILASIIEKETAVAEERGRVASVFVNRLEKGMPLQTDPTVIYGVTGGKGALGRGLRRSELDRETPYNTYKIAGLPPTPIANPGRASILAALNPDRTEDLYFVADGTGGHAFAASYDAHLKNVAKWRAIEAEAAKSKQAQ